LRVHVERDRRLPPKTRCSRRLAFSWNGGRVEAAARQTFNMRHDTLLRLIGFVYDAATDVTGWERFLCEVSKAVGGTSVGLLQHQVPTSSPRWRDGRRLVVARPRGRVGRVLDSLQTGVVLLSESGDRQVQFRADLGVGSEQRHEPPTAWPRWRQRLPAAL
jgi:hypothetical protein